ncbi:hypothetical protein C8J57DRAFT_1436339 [Mycena rebaudengoi]|nr:hypothetical protein C8J57DRAFT_1436339 [Mycena rebaudengoi]
MSASNSGAPQNIAEHIASIPALDPSVICTGFAKDGQNPPPDIPLTNGLQITTGSCNPAPIGLIPSVDKMPSAEFSLPQNNGNIAANKDFLVTMNDRNFCTGVFTNALKTYFAAPQTLDANGLIIGHSHVVIESVIESLTSLIQTEPTDPKKLIFFKVHSSVMPGVPGVDVTKGVPAGAYRICTINSSSNHQPVIVPIAQHGSLDDCVYMLLKFTAT